MEEGLDDAVDETVDEAVVDVDEEELEVVVDWTVVIGWAK